jgi:hypothetical protein
VIADAPNAVLIAVGPDAAGEWQTAERCTQGRIVAVGTRWDNHLLYAAADVYLDSIPFSSITSLLEAGSRGAALVGYRSADPELVLLGPGAPGLDEVMELAEDKQSYQALLARVIRDADYRARLGHAVREQIGKSHMGRNWTQLVQNLYELPVNERGCLAVTEDTFEKSELGSALFQLYGEWKTRQMIRNLLSPLSYRSRFLASWRLYRAGFHLCIVSLLPPPIHGIVLALGRRLKAVNRKTVLQPQLAKEVQMLVPKTKS